jgi:hypothetical protein
VIEPLRYQIHCFGLPLAVYREVAAHLRQVKGVDVGLMPQTSGQFDYKESQIGGLWIQYGLDAEANSRERVQQILAYYQNRYGVWQEYTEPIVAKTADG